MSKFKIIVASVLVALLCATSALTIYLMYQNIQLSKDLDAKTSALLIKEEGIQDLNNKLGIAKSQLITKEELNSKYKEELALLESDFKKLTSKHKLELESRDSLIVKLNGKVNGGNTTVVIKKPLPSTPSVNEGPVTEPTTTIISYEWEDSSKRFHLLDPDIFTQNDEVFEYNQKASITGYVYTDKSGKVKIRKMVLKEVIVDKDGNKVPVPGSNIEIVDNQFEYIKSDPDPKSLWDLWHPKLIASFDTQLRPGIGVEFLNLENLIDYANIGLNAKIAANLSDGLNGIPNSTIGVGVAYHIVPPALDTNFALGIGIATPMDNFLNRYILTIDAILYLTN